MLRAGGWQLDANDASGLLAIASYASGRYPSIWGLRAQSHSDVVDRVQRYLVQEGAAGAEVLLDRIVIDDARPGVSRVQLRVPVQSDAAYRVFTAAFARADSALREQVQSLLSEWQLADPNPEDYRHMLQYLSTAAPAGSRHEQAAEPLNTLRLVQMALEVGTWGPLVDRSITTCLKEGGAATLVTMLREAPAESGVSAERLRDSLTQPLAIASIASREPLDEATLDYLMPWLSM